MMTKRQAFKIIDQNKDAQIVGGKALKSPSRTKSSVPLKPKTPADENSTNAKQKKATFDQICQLRVPEDREDDLCELGICAWSFGDFDCIRKLGSGACATVYAAREKISGHVVALKIQLADDGDLSECYFQDEVEIHETLEHHSIVNMVDYFYSNTPFKGAQDFDFESGDGSEPVKYLCMILELCDGKDLYDTLKATKNKRLNEETTKKLFVSALESLEYIHANKIIHCDIKPSNFLLHGARLKLADFGMAVRVEEREILGGSPVYMSPEHMFCWRSGSDDFDHRADIYSLGAVLYECLTGELPYDIIEEDEDMHDYLLLAGMNKLSLDDNYIQAPSVDIRRLDELSSLEDLVFPPPQFPAYLSEDAKDLILKLMNSCADSRITLEEARKHPWLQVVKDGRFQGGE